VPVMPAIATRNDLLAALVTRCRAVDVPHTTRVAIDGPDAAGKTSLAADLATAIGAGAIRVSIDGFHHPAAIRKRRELLSAEGYYRDSFDNDMIVSAVLRPLGPAGDARFVRATFDYRTDQTVPSPVETAAPGSILICDGVFLLRPELRHHWDLTIYLHVDPEETLRRALVRDLYQFGSRAEVERRYRGRYLPGQQLYRTEADPISRADLAIDNTDPARPVIIRSTW
jgi:uridine kinase